MIRTLLFSTLFPSASRPIHGIFVETRLRELLKLGGVETKVVAPVPWFPFKGERWGEYGKIAATPIFERRGELDVYHPRYFLPPKIGMYLAPYFLALGALPAISRLVDEGFDFDLIDAHYYYPDGVAAGLLARWLKKPFVVTARGTDISLISSFSLPKKMIVETASRASASIGVCKALVEEIARLGVNRTTLYTMRNGVDLARFVPVDRVLARSMLNTDATAKRILLSVGHLIERKGHHIAIEALRYLPSDTHLYVAGSGPEAGSLEKLAARLCLKERVHFLGQIPNENLRDWYSAADALVLCSSREGWANVLLESMACGTPVVATNIWGTPEVVSDVVAGRLMTERTPESCALALDDLFLHYPDPAAVRAYAESFSWENTSTAQLELFRSIAHA